MAVLRRAAALLAGVALLGSSAYAVATSDAFVRRIVRSVLGRTFAGPTHVDDASFTFREGLVIRGIEVRDPWDPLGAPAVRVDEIRAAFDLGLGAEGPGVREVTLLRPSVRIRRREDGILSASALLQPIPETDGRTVRPPTVVVTDATVEYDDPDLVGGGAVTLTAVNARLEPRGDAWRCDVTGTSADLGNVHAVAFLSPGNEVTGHVDVPALPLDPRILRRFRIPGAAAATAFPATGSVKVHAEMAFGPGHEPLVGVVVDLAGLATEVRLPEPGATAPAPRAIPVHVVSGRAEMKGGEVVLSDLDLRFLDATVRCERARIAGLAATETAGSPPPGASIDAVVRVDGLVLRDEIHDALPSTVRRVVEAFGLRAAANVRATVSGPLASPRLDVEADVTGGRVCYVGHLRDDGTRHGFPWEVTDAGGTVAFRGGNLVTFTLNGRHGPARVYAKGSLDYATGDEIPDVTIVVEDAPLDADLRAAFQDRAEKVYDRWGPSGTAARIDVRVVRDPHDDGPAGEATEVTLHLDGRASVRPRLLPLPFSDVRGRVEVTYPSRGDHRAERVRLVGVRAQSEGVRVRVDGRVDTDRSFGTDDLVVEADVDDTSGPVRGAIAESAEFIPPNVKRLFEDLGPAGPVRLTAEVAGDPDRRRDRVTLALRGAAVRGYRDVPFAASNLTGRVTVDGDTVVLDDIAGTALGSDLRGSGRLLGIASGTVEPDVTIDAVAMPLGTPLRNALGPLADRAAAFWEHLGPADGPSPAGTRADVHVVLRPSSDATPFECRLRRLRGSLRPRGLALGVEEGELAYDGRVASLECRGTLGGADVVLRDGRLDVATGVVDLDLDARALRFPWDVAALFSAETAAAIGERIPGCLLDAAGLRVRYDPGPERLDLSGDLDFRAAEDPDAPATGLAPEGSVEMRRLTFWFPPGLPVTFDGSVRPDGFAFRPGLDVTKLEGLVALAGRIDEEGVDLFARTEGARLRVEDHPLRDATIHAQAGPAGPRVEATADFHGGRLTARFGPGGPAVEYAGEIHVRGADVSKLAKTGDVSGSLSADVLFRNASGEPADLRGSVEVTVSDGDLVRFPLVSAILNVIPGAGKLTDAILSGSLEGRTLAVRDMVIRGPILSLTQGRGTVGFDGDLDLSLNPGIPLTSIAVRGSVGKPDVTLRLLSTGK